MGYLWRFNNLGEVLKEEMEARCLSVKDLASRSGVSATTIRRILRSESRWFGYSPKLETVDKLSSALPAREG